MKLCRRCEKSRRSMHAFVNGVTHLFIFSKKLRLVFKLAACVLHTIEQTVFNNGCIVQWYIEQRAWEISVNGTSIVRATYSSYKVIRFLRGTARTKQLRKRCIYIYLLWGSHEWNNRNFVVRGKSLNRKRRKRLPGNFYSLLFLMAIPLFSARETARWR